jgi:hypothetical protein
MRRAPRSARDRDDIVLSDPHRLHDNALIEPAPTMFNDGFQMG